MTDVLFLLLFIVSWGAFFLNYRWCTANGANPNKILKGIDFKGRMCGLDDGVEDKPLAAWPYPLAPEVMICVKNCAATSAKGNEEIVWSHSSTPYLGYCLPFPNGTIGVEVNITMTGDFDEWFNTAGMAFYRGSSDVFLCMEVIAFSTLIALLLSYAYVELLNHVAGCLIATCTLLIGVSGLVLGYTMYEYSFTIAADSYMGEEKAAFLEYGSYTVWTLTGIFLLVMFALRTQIRIGIEVVKEAARALMDIKLIIFLPVVPLVVMMAYSAVWLYIGLTVFSVSTLKHEPMPDSIQEHWITGRKTVYDNATLSIYRVEPDQIYASGGIHLFCGLWTLQFAIYALYSVIAGAVASWYFTPRDSEGNKLRGGEEGLPTSIIWRSFCRLCRYHLGTVALASLIIAIIQTVRAFVRYIEMKLKNGGNPGAVATALLKVLQCCLKCAECCMDKINKNGLVWTAIYGDGFCVASCSAFALIWRNLFRLAAVNTVSTILLTIGKVSIALTNMCVFGLTLEYSVLGANISSPYGPAIVIFILSYFVARMFMALFETLIDTTFFCFLVDSENNDKGMMLAHKNLQKLVGKYEKDSARQATLVKMNVEDSKSDGSDDSDDAEVVEMQDKKPKKTLKESKRASKSTNQNRASAASSKKKSKFSKFSDDDLDG